MSWFFRRQSNAAVGIDIQPRSIRLATISRAADFRWFLESYAIEPLPPNAIHEYRICDHDSVAQTLQRALETSQTRVKRAATAMSSQVVVSKRIAVAVHLSGKALEQFIFEHLEQYVPYVADDVAVDFCTLGVSREDPGMQDVLLVACPKMLIESHIAVMTLSGLTPCLIDTEELALSRVCRFSASRSERTLAMLEVSASALTLKVLRSGCALFSRTLSNEEASLCHLLEQTLTCAVDRWWLTGGQPDIDICCERLKRLGIAAACFDPVRGMAVNPALDRQALSRDAPALAIACGLAQGVLD